MKKEKEAKNTWQPVGEKFKGAKIAKTFRIDAEVFLWLRKEADRTGIPYQTLLNAKLREAMNLPDRVEALVQNKFDELMKKRGWHQK